MAKERKPGGPIFASQPWRPEPGERLIVAGQTPCLECDAVGRAWLDPRAHAHFHANEAVRHANEAVRYADKAERYARIGVILAPSSLGFAVLARIRRPRPDHPDRAVNDLLCASPRCKPPARHKPDCVGDPQTPCRGCLPARAADGLRLCQYETDRLAVHPVEAAGLWIELGLALVSSGAGDGIGQKNPGRGLNLNPKVVEHRTLIRHRLVSWTLLVCEERGFTPPRDSVEQLGKFLANQARWLAAQDFAGEVADEMAELVEVGRSLRQPSSTRIIEIGPCPRMSDPDGGEDDEQLPCPGVLRALLRSEASLLPSAVQCDTNEDHAWDSTQWTKLGRAMQAMKMERLAA